MCKYVDKKKKIVTIHFKNMLLKLKKVKKCCLNFTTCIKRAQNNFVHSPVFSNCVCLLDTLMWPSGHQKCSYVWSKRNYQIVSTFWSFVAKWKMWYNKNPWWVGNFENLHHFYNYQQQIFWLSWNLEMYIYKSCSESWMSECFACI